MKRSSFEKLLAICALTAVGSGMATAQSGSGIVSSVVKAPVSPDGDVAGAATDLVINLAMDMDPAASGKVLRAGESIGIVLPESFTFADSENYPLRDLFAAPDCVPANLKCSTGVLLQGWPQQPILPSFPPGKEPQCTLSFDTTTNTLVYTASKDIDGVPLPGPGIKQAHLIVLGFRNPEQAGSYPVRVSIFDAGGKERESGLGYLTVRSDTAPSINVTSVFVPGDENAGKPPNPNTIYQQTKPGESAPMPWDFLVWDSDGKPHVGIEIVQEDGNGGRLVRDGKLVGRFTIASPTGAEGQTVAGGPSIELPGTPVIGNSFGKPIPVGRLTASFTAGSEPGRYFTTFALEGGNSATMIVDVAAGG